MFSPAKIIGLLAILWIVWMVFKLLERRQNLPKDNKNKPNDSTDTHAGQQAVDVAECSHCHKFVPKGGCADKNCPLRS
ncbi:MAG: hypothetical protein ISQ23_01540 [Alphaproteobacteria bacterium]|nr:hypothetical protein [Alphaproteobacteria bacterium]MBL6776170.1 hypothetical protein [Alphaproteobacteria bacterium]